jgi:hypothetical protein
VFLYSQRPSARQGREAWSWGVGLLLYALVIELEHVMSSEQASVSLLVIGPLAAALLVYALGRHLHARPPVLPFVVAFGVSLAALRILTIAQL